MTATKKMAPPQSYGVAGDKPWILPPHKPIQFINANLIDPVDGKVIEHARVTAVGGRITRLTARTSVEGDKSDEENTAVVDLKGKYMSSRLNNLAHPQFLDEELQAMVRTAASFDTDVTAHAYTVRAMRHIIDNGVLGIEHGNFLDRELAELMVEKGIFLTLTLVTHDAMSIPPYNQFQDEDCAKKNAAILGSGLNALKIAHEAGVTMCFGSDLIAGMHQFQRKEFTIRSQVLPALGVLQSATVNCAKMLRREEEIGQVKEGFLADFIVLEKNPLEDIRVLDDNQNLLAVVKAEHIAFSSLEALPVSIERKPW
ncbi:hypothetical protein QQX98_004472 [Neonectria punicea]|uniref:Amidohydrolase-related domain-containing protein n=1 Tax=Neonectria punicea TaxID=979145 RepID=A0ABR1H944_9HYPO